ncbi:hypothetical protein AGRA3207_004431 [Actinomadura graeca]|uniref:TetR family transcriptional regulator n=1 Tax=Actinomadura graeca TaxID=2750812 RepID=A0ABX8QWT7_9ACTN|nr:hypothetical protein [Actinomadura graeca]QXJ23294.1 hypothetical protein AGRA3207_004431 [Actinomadura graeca]
MTDDHVATLRVRLAGRPGKRHHRWGRPGPSEADAGYAALISAAFYEAACRRFVRNGWPADDAEVTAFITAARAAPNIIVPATAERLINHAIGKVPLEANDDIDPRVAIRVRTLLLTALVGDLHFGDAQLDRFMARSRQLAQDSLR